MIGSISHFFVIFVQTAATACFCFYIFHDMLKACFARLAVYTFFLCCFCGFLSLTVCEICSRLPLDVDSELISLFIMFIIGYFCLRSVVSENSNRILFVLYLSLHVQYLCLSVTYLAYAAWFPALSVNYDYVPADIPGYTLPILLLGPPFAVITRRIYTTLRQADDTVYHRIWFIPLLFLLLYCVQVLFYPVSQKDTQAEANLMRLIISICAFVTYSQMATAVAQTATATQEKVIHTQLAHQLDLQRSRMEDIETHAEEIRRIRHDHRQHMQVLKGLLENGDTGKALDYLNGYETSTAANIQPVLCENFVVNTLCCRYETLALQSGIAVTRKLKLPQDIAIAGCDLAVIVGNLWENAVAAALDADKEHRFISLHIQERDNTVFIRMENGYGGIIYQKDGQILSTKPDRNKTPGVGIASIKSVAARYDGMADFVYTPEIFTASVLLYTGVKSAL